MKNVTENRFSNEDKWQYLASLLERDGACVGETEFSVTMNGIYSVPDEWLKLEASGAVDSWFYGAKVSEINFGEGKTNPRELTETEKKEMEAKKNSKNDKKKVEVTQAELERIEKERQEKEEKERIFLEEWNQLDEQTKFYRKKENPTEECWISFPFGKNVLSILKNGDKLLDLEEEINTDQGMLLEFFKVPPPDEDPKKRPKPKNISPEDVKPIFAVAWLDLSELQIPGRTETTLRASLMLKETWDKKLELQENYDKMKSQNADEEDLAELEEELQNLTDYVLNKQTYIYLTISLSVPINPKVPEKPFPNPMDLLKKPEKPFKQITADQICEDFRNQLKIAIAAIAKQYEEFIGEAKNNLIKRDKNNVLTNDRKQERDSNITKFIYNFNHTGKADLLNEKLKKFIVRIVREKYKKKSNVMGVFKNEKDQFYSSLYAYLTDEVKLAMDEYIYLKNDELHEHVLSSYDQSRKEVMQYASRINKETEEQRLFRLSKEYDIKNEMDKALFYSKARLTLNKSKDAWKEYIVQTKKMGLIIDTEDAIVNIIQLDPEDFNYKLLYAAVKWIKGRPNDAINFLLSIIEEMKGIKNSNSQINAMLALLYKESYNLTKDKMKDLLYKKHWESAIRLKLKEQGQVQFFVGKSK
jgi:hypothetical protein